MNAISAGFSVEMILIAQTLLFTLIFVKPLLKDLMNIIVAMTVGLKRAPECMHHLEGENTILSHSNPPPQTRSTT